MAMKYRNGVTGPDHGEPHLDAGHCYHFRQHPAGGKIPETILLESTIFHPAKFHNLSEPPGHPLLQDD